MITWTIDDVPAGWQKSEKLAKEIVGDYIRCIVKPDKIMIDVMGFGKILFDSLRLNHPEMPTVGFVKEMSGIRVVEDLPKCDCGEGEGCHLCPKYT